METWITSRRGKRQTIYLVIYTVSGIRFFRILRECPRGIVENVMIDGLSFTDNERKARTIINHMLKGK